MSILFDWKLHALCVVCIVIAELIGTIQIGFLILIPMFFSLIIGVVFSLQKKFKGLMMKVGSMKGANTLVTISLMLLIVKMSLDVGPMMDKLKEASFALIMQEVGHIFGPIILGLPLALALGLGREAVGMIFSIGQEQSVAIIADKYGLDSLEGSGVMAQYLIGNLFGAICVGFLAGLFGSLGLINPVALAMGVGVGSGSMTAAGSGALITLYPELASEIRGYAGIANLMSNILGIYIYMFFSLPFTSWLWDRMVTIFRKDKKAQLGGS